MKNRPLSWLDRLIQADQRYVCGFCDDRFADQASGIEHMQRCHPEVDTVVVYDGASAESPEPAQQAQPVIS